MKIGFVIYGSPRQLSGGYRYDRELAAALIDRGHELIFIDLPRGSGRRPGKLPIFSVGYDLLLLDELCHPDLYSSLAGLELPTVGVVHHLASNENLPLFHRLRHRRMERRFLNRLSGSVFNTEATRFAAEKLCGRRLPGFVVLPGREERASGSAGPGAREVPSNEICILSVGNLIPRKGIDRVLIALARIVRQNGGRPGFRYRIVGDREGDPRYLRRLEQLAADPELTGRVEFVGRCSDEELAAEYAAADIFCLPSDHEGFGIVYLEAMGAGCAVVASSSGGAGTLIRDGENGFLVSPRRLKALEGILSRLLEDSGLRGEVSREARSSWERFPCWRESMRRGAAELEGFIARHW